MIPILYETTETEFASNGLGRLRDCIECRVVEERNGIYECDFQYPLNGSNYEDIQIGRIIGVTHDDSGDIQPFDIVSYSKPIDGIVTFHCTHISYRQSYMTVTGTNIGSLADAFALLSTAQPSNPFSYDTDKSSTGYLGAGDGIPHSVRQMLGGMQGSILDAYGGEYEWNKWSVFLHSARGQVRDFSIRYGVNMLDYNEDFNTEGTYSSCIPYWTDGTNTVVGSKVNSNGATLTDRDECVPLDLSDKFETQPTTAQLENVALTYMNNNNTFLPSQNIHVEFVRLQDLGYEEYRYLLECNLCDTINVIYPDYNSSGQYKIVKTIWDVLRDRYESMELGDLSISLSQALGLSNEPQSPSSILNQIYPVGSIYISTNSVSPSALFGGTWQRIQGRFLLATGTPDSNTDNFFGSMSGTTYNAGVKTKGGQDYHTLTVDEMPSHKHGVGYTNGSANGNYAGMPGTSVVPQNYNNELFINNKGGGEKHNNMPPYYAVYMWERTA